jgi:hypothetical protein
MSAEHPMTSRPGEADCPRASLPAHGRGPNGPCEDIAQCPICLDFSAGLRPIGEVFYPHDPGCQHILHWGPCEAPEPIENQSTEWVKAELAAAIAATRERVARDIEVASRESVGWLAEHATDDLDRARLIGNEDAYRDSARIARVSQ